jgi:hypothetical protein
VQHQEFGGCGGELKRDLAVGACFVVEFEDADVFAFLEMEMIDVLLNYVCTPGGNRDRKNKNVWT